MINCKHHINQFHGDCNVCGASVSDIISTLQVRNEALEKLLDPKTLARKIGDWDFTHNSDYFCWKFGGDGDNGEMLIEALTALLQEPAK